jgi:hypothetical protein
MAILCLAKRGKLLSSGNVLAQAAGGGQLQGADAPEAAEPHALAVHRDGGTFYNMI